VPYSPQIDCRSFLVVDRAGRPPLRTLTLSKGATRSLKASSSLVVDCPAVNRGKAGLSLNWASESGLLDAGDDVDRAGQQRVVERPSRSVK